MAEDKQIRHKQKMLKSETPQHFGVSTYLLLNEQTPILEIAIERDAVVSKIDLHKSRQMSALQRNNTLSQIF
jgi:hypothetical protein